MSFVDTNVVIDLLRPAGPFADWSYGTVRAAILAGRVRISTLVFAELAAGYASQDMPVADLETLDFDVVDAPKDALFLAGQAFAAYRRSGGVLNNVLPDFIVGAQAFVAKAVLITRDTRVYRNYFPDLTLVTPGKV